MDIIIVVVINLTTDGVFFTLISDGVGGHLTFRILSLLRYVVDIGKRSPNPIFFFIIKKGIHTMDHVHYIYMIDLVYVFLGDIFLEGGGGSPLGGI